MTNILGPKNDPASGKCCGVYIEAVPTGTNSGTPITQGGLMSGGEWYDVVAGLAKLKALVKERVFNIQLNEPKVPFTSKGIETLAGATRGALRDMSTDPYNLLVGDSIVVETVAIDDVSDADKAARYYDGISFGADLQGAIRAVAIDGTVSP
jgi:hypothetical protein